MIGQEKLQSQISEINSLDNLSKSIIICGEKGIGKHTLVNIIINKFKIDTEFIDYELSSDILQDMYALSIPKLYIIDCEILAEHKRIERFQNTILKFIEEPPEFAWIIILVSELDSLLETIQNRCQIYKFTPYSIEDLRIIARTQNKDYTDEILRLLRVPGNIINKDISQLEQIQNLASNIIRNINKATPANALSIRQQFFGDYALDIDLFLSIFNQTLYEYLKQENYNNQKLLAGLALSKETQRKLRIMNVNKVDVIDHFLMNIKQVLT